jgi:hypothetical protein
VLLGPSGRQTAVQYWPKRRHREGPAASRVPSLWCAHTASRQAAPERTLTPDYSLTRVRHYERRGKDARPHPQTRRTSLRAQRPESPAQYLRRSQRPPSRGQRVRSVVLQTGRCVRSARARGERAMPRTPGAVAALDVATRVPRAFAVPRRAPSQRTLQGRPRSPAASVPGRRLAGTHSSVHFLC